ncbi:hypothetical protein [Spongiactinospora sp. TRM90649]|uniref:hypothetical protein n=1 Tax=Spongiactinospora sp. TRM90649 TaxID=3031114 RepID=UPI0023F8F742|nr:hypothetical protein [Spongiactinospora sp. TRM90649]MDF5755791.1 hypothetical protein [Spongiactinospora sp. TRM90649]
MTGNTVDRAMPQLPAPRRVGQATAIEQSRAVAEVHAAILVAQQNPRDTDAALAEMRRSCERLALAEKAFYDFPRDDKIVTGPTIYLARELARIWGNIQHGIHELSRDDDHGQSEMQAFAWDVEKNTRVSSTFIVPHKRDTRRGAKPITDMRGVYENNTNNGARRVREAIFATLPPWFSEEAQAICRATLEAGDGRVLPARVTEAIAAFDALGVTADRIERKLGIPRGEWTPRDVSRLEITYRSIRNGELSADEVFPAPRVTASDVIGEQAPPQGEAS